MNCFRTSDLNLYAKHKYLLRLPFPNPNLIRDLFIEVRNIFETEAVILDVHSPVVVVGDLHGHILDLYRILTIFGLPSQRRRYLFLGDFVDRGEFSIEVIIIVFILKVLFPDQIFIIRGNHEFEFLCSQCGFMTQMIDFFGDNTLFNECETTFEYIPLAARIDNKILCVHGGIGPEFTSVSQLYSIRRPIDDYDGIIDSLVWSDPNADVENGEYKQSTRGSGYLFGEKAVDAFMANNPNIEMIIRGHECVNEGVHFHFNNKICTVFSASNYCGIVGNQAGVLELTGPMQYKSRQFPPIDWLYRADVLFCKESDIGDYLKSKDNPNKLNLIPETQSQKLKSVNSYKAMPVLDPSFQPGKLTTGIGSQSVKQLPILDLTEIDENTFGTNLSFPVRSNKPKKSIVKPVDSTRKRTKSTFGPFRRYPYF